jgi:hypothetical protein
MFDAEVALGFLKAFEASHGAEFCDKCGGTIWPELELVRCGPCVGKYGEPAQERVQAAHERNKERIRRFERELEEI